MRLSQIKLSGFKSFPDSVTIPLQGNIVAVVGPNGCGKSNLIDAVRWVLGESSAKQLRGEQLQDVIFNGTNHRRKVSRASVELIFDNSQGLLQGSCQQYQEISIKRILTREGDSSYWLNAQRVRKKDITDLFLGTGLGTKGYAVIEQGMIAKIIEAKPEDLRAYIDEAAGISKYKDRRKETENRLTSAEESLERINDLKSELAHQYQKLNKQAKKAQKYTQIKGELEHIQALLLAAQWSICSEKLQAFLQQQNQAKQALASLLEQVQHDNEQNDTVQVEEYAIQEALKNYYQQKSELSESIVNLETELKFKRNAHAKAKQQKYHLERELQALKTEIQQKEKILTDLQLNLGEKESARAKATEQLADLYQTTEKLEQAFEAGEALYTKVKANEVAFSAKKEALYRNRLELERLLSRLQVQQSHSVGHELLEVTVEEARLQELSSQLSRLMEKINQTEQSLAKLQQTIKHGEKIKQHQQKELIALSVELRVLTKQQASIEAVHDGFWKPFSALQLTPLWQRLSIDPKWQHALETYLGGKLLARIAPQLPFYPDNTENEAVWINHLPTKQSFPPAEDSILHRVKAEEEISALLVDWLGQVRCVNSLEEGLSKQAVLSNTDVLLTPKGIIIDCHAVYWPTQYENDSVLALQNKISALRQEEANLQDVSNQHQTKILKLTQQKEALFAELKRLNTEKNQVQSELNTTQQMIVSIKAKNEIQQKFLAQAKMDISQLQQQKVVLERQQQTLVDEIEAITAEQTHDKTLVEEQYFSLKQVLKEARKDLLVHEKKNNHAALAVIEVNNRVEQISQTLKASRQKAVILSAQAQEVVCEEDAHTIDDYQIKIANLMESLQQINQTISELELNSQLLRQQKEAIKVALEQQKSQRKVLEHSIHTYELDIQQEKIYQSQFEEALRERKQNVSELIALSLQSDYNVKELSDKVLVLTSELEALGAVNLTAVIELKEVEERYEFYQQQYNDLVASVEMLQKAICAIDAETEKLFASTLQRVNEFMAEFFPKLLGGGESQLVSTSDELLGTGLRLMARPGGKKNSTIHWLSGGEKALTALSLVFSLFSLNPAPFCLLDEVDAPLDDTNTSRFSQLVKEMSKTVQFLFVSHNQLTMEMAEQLIGVTMQEKGVSKIVSVDIKDTLPITQ